MSVVVCFEDGPAVGQIRDCAYLSVALPRLAWTGDHGEVQAVYDRECDRPDDHGMWHYRQNKLA
jgi:hypothetical protein